MNDQLQHITSIIEDLIESLKNPAYNHLEVGFRHNPLTIKEQLERYQQTCGFAVQDLTFILKLLKAEKINEENH